MMTMVRGSREMASLQAEMQRSPRIIGTRTRSGKNVLTLDRMIASETEMAGSSSTERSRLQSVSKSVRIGVLGKSTVLVLVATD